MDRKAGNLTAQADKQGDRRGQDKKNQEAQRPKTARTRGKKGISHLGILPVIVLKVNGCPEFLAAIIGLPTAGFPWKTPGLPSGEGTSAKVQK
ncbi:MAG: hypothetical protein NTZ12_11005 [Candidatus Aminicenantes bacterium]|nr:hypothetical protein [Candidatus Aminicenantes bacterium]